MSVRQKLVHMEMVRYIEVIAFEHTNTERHVPKKCSRNFKTNKRKPATVSNPFPQIDFSQTSLRNVHVLESGVKYIIT